MLYYDEIPYELKGVPCLLGIKHYLYQPAFKGSAYLCDNPDDYYGYEEIEYDILDSEGCISKSLMDKLRKEDFADIRMFISKYCANERKCRE